LKASQAARRVIETRSNLENKVVFQAVGIDRTPYTDEEEALVEVGKDKSKIWMKEGSGS
jgi:hypothetical protein